ncbi:MAG: hypothetical protein RL621_316 [Bacteroidota bacterium]
MMTIHNWSNESLEAKTAHDGDEKNVLTLDHVKVLKTLNMGGCTLSRGEKYDRCYINFNLPAEEITYSFFNEGFLEPVKEFVVPVNWGLAK